MDGLIKKYNYILQLNNLYFINRSILSNDQEVDQYQIIQDLKADLFEQFDLHCCSTGLEYYQVNEDIADYLAEEGLLV